MNDNRVALSTRIVNALMIVLFGGGLIAVCLEIGSSLLNKRSTFLGFVGLLFLVCALTLLIGCAWLFQAAVIFNEGDSDDKAE